MEIIIIKGLLTGFFLSLMLGPSFFLLIETSIQKGIRAAFSFDAGVLFSDILYILIAYLFYQEVSTLLSGNHIFILKIIGGVLFILFGLLTLKKKKTIALEADNNKIGSETINGVGTAGYFKLFLKGFLWNFANPAIIIYWLTVISVGIQETEDIAFFDPIAIYLAIILVTFFSIDVFKIFAAKKLRPFITPSLLSNLSRFICFILIGFGAVFFIQGIVHFIKL